MLLPLLVSQHRAHVVSQHLMHTAHTCTATAGLMMLAVSCIEPPRLAVSHALYASAPKICMHGSCACLLMAATPGLVVSAVTWADRCDVSAMTWADRSAVHLPALFMRLVGGRASMCPLPHNPPPHACMHASPGKLMMSACQCHVRVL